MLIKIIKKIFTVFINLLNTSSIGRRVKEIIFRSAFNNTIKICHKEVSLIFSVPNNWALSRATTFSSKEPDTLNWIDSFDPDVVFWDVGANIGLYSIYTALKKNNSTVISFEPSVLNLELLARNIFLNKLQNKIAIFPTPLNNKNEINNFYMTSLQWGAAESTFGEKKGHDGLRLDAKFSYKTPSFNADSLVKYLNLPKPNALKIDVDGIEHLILEGAEKMLEYPKLKTILIEVNENYSFQKNKIEKILNNKNWKLTNKYSVYLNKNSTKLEKTYNQIWIKN